MIGNEETGPIMSPVNRKRTPRKSLATYTGRKRVFPHGVVIDTNVTYKISIILPNFGYTVYQVLVDLPGGGIYLPYADPEDIWMEWHPYET